MYRSLEDQKHELQSKLIFLASLIFSLLLLGMLVYHFSEGWSYLDSLYFAAISLTSRGFSEMHPSNWFSVLFSIFYLIIGVSILIYSVSTLVAYYTSFYESKVNELLKKKKPKDKWVELRIKR